MTELVRFNKTNIAKTGNDFVKAMLMHEAAREAAEREIAAAHKRDNTIDFELTRLVMILHESEKIDVARVFETKQQTSSLYRSILKEAGVLTSEVVDDKVVYSFTDPELKDAFTWEDKIASYVFDPEKEKKPRYDEDTIMDHKSRRSRRNGLNMRLARVCKAAFALVDTGASVNDLKYENDKPVITKGPKAIMGDNDKVVIQTGSSARKAEGASIPPTITGLSKVAVASREDQTSSKAETESNSGTATGGIDEKDMLASMNTLLMMVKGREGVFSDVEKQAMVNLVTEIEQNLA